VIQFVPSGSGLTCWRVLQDTWAEPNGRLVVDSQQDCLGFRHVQRNDVVKFTFTRRFDTCDPQDYVIEVSSIRAVRRTHDKSFVFWYRKELPAVQSLQQITFLRVGWHDACGVGAGQRPPVPAGGSQCVKRRSKRHAADATAEEYRTAPVTPFRHMAPRHPQQRGEGPWRWHHLLVPCAQAAGRAAH
jgi:hypothetical protein